MTDERRVQRIHDIVCTVPHKTEETTIELGRDGRMNKTTKTFRLGAIEQCYGWPNGRKSDAQLINYGRLDAEEPTDLANSCWCTCDDSFGLMFPPDVQPSLGTKYLVTVEEITDTATRISRDEYDKLSEELSERVRRVLDDKFGMIGDWTAGSIVDAGTDVDKLNSNRVGIRLDNNYGVVDVDDALKFCEALSYATKLIGESNLIGCEVVE